MRFCFMFIIVIIITSSSNTSGPEWPPRKCTNTVLFSVHVPTEGLGGQFVIPDLYPLIAVGIHGMLLLLHTDDRQRETETDWTAADSVLMWLPDLMTLGAVCWGCGSYSIKRPGDKARGAGFFVKGSRIN